MCEPVTIALVSSAALTIGSGIVQAQAQLQQGESRAAMFRYQSSLAIQNARRVRLLAAEQREAIENTAERNITATQIAAADESQRLLRDVSIVAGAQRATIGAFGIGGGVTAEDIARDTFTKSQLDQSAIRYNANLKSWQISTEAKHNVWILGEESRNRIWSLEVEAKQYDYAGRFAKKAAKKKAIGTILSTATQVAGIAAFGFATAGGAEKVAQAPVLTTL